MSNVDPKLQIELEELQREIGHGLDVRQWCENTQVGRYLLARANADRQAALEQLADADAMDGRLMTELQWRARTPALFIDWLGQAVTAGENAEREHESRHQLLHNDD